MSVVRSLTLTAANDGSTKLSADDGYHDGDVMVRGLVVGELDGFIIKLVMPGGC